MQTFFQYLKSAHSTISFFYFVSMVHTVHSLAFWSWENDLSCPQLERARTYCITLYYFLFSLCPGHLCMKAEIRQCHLVWVCVFLESVFFTAVLMYTNDLERATNIDLDYRKFYWVGELVDLEFVNNENQLYILYTT